MSATRKDLINLTVSQDEASDLMDSGRAEVTDEAGRVEAVLVLEGGVPDDDVEKDPVEDEDDEEDEEPADEED